MGQADTTALSGAIDIVLRDYLINGVGSRMFAPGPFARLEEPIHHMINAYLTHIAA